MEAHLKETFGIRLSSNLSIKFTSYGAKEFKDDVTFNFVEDLPFPLSMPYHWRIFFGLYIVLILVGGLFFRKIILQYLLAPETKSNPINSLIWVDQGLES